MDQNSNKSAMQNGLIAGLLISFGFLLGTFDNGFLNLLKIIISIYSIFYLYTCSVKYRDKALNSAMTFFEAFKYVFKVYIFACIIESVIILIYVHLFPNYLPTLMNKILKFYDAVNPKYVEMYYDSIVLTFKPSIFPISNLMSSAIFAAFLGLILGLFLKKEKSIFEE